MQVPPLPAGEGWPSTYRGYHCEATAQLPNAGTNTWTPVTNVATGTTEFRSTNTAAAAARFFRLAL